MIYLRTIFHIPDSNGSLAVAVKLKFMKVKQDISYSCQIILFSGKITSTKVAHISKIYYHT
jgi:hypothetical protein